MENHRGFVENLFVAQASQRARALAKAETLARAFVEEVIRASRVGGDRQHTANPLYIYFLVLYGFEHEKRLCILGRHSADLSPCYNSLQRSACNHSGHNTEAHILTYSLAKGLLLDAQTILYVCGGEVAWGEA